MALLHTFSRISVTNGYLNGLYNGTDATVQKHYETVRKIVDLTMCFKGNTKRDYCITQKRSLACYCLARLFVPFKRIMDKRILTEGEFFVKSLRPNLVLSRDIETRRAVSILIKFFCNFFIPKVSLSSYHFGIWIKGLRVLLF